MEGGDDVAGKGDVNTCTTARSAMALQLPSQEHQCQRFWWLSRFLPRSSIPNARFQLAAQYSFRTIKQPHE